MNSMLSNIIYSRWLRLSLLLVLVYFSQIYPFYHLHHSHNDDIWDITVSSHPVDIEVAHSQDESDHHHQHHDEDRPQPESHQHTYDKHIDWHLLRTHHSTRLTIDKLPSLVISFKENSPDQLSTIFIHLPTFSKDKSDIASLLTRAPPLS